MIKHSEHREVPTAKKRWKKKAPLKNTIQSAVADSQKEEYKTNKTDEITIHLNKWDKWVMPQLRAYIKCPPYDFL